MSGAPGFSPSTAPSISHGYDFDPSYGYTVGNLLEVGVPTAPADFTSFWTSRYERTLEHAPRTAIRDLGWDAGDLRVFDLSYSSTEGARINGWVVLPRHEPVERACIVGHGYGGREGPDLHLPIDRCAFLFPCFRGLGKSPHPPISSESQWHVLHDIHLRDRYVIGGCVEDLWVAVTAVTRLFPQVRGRIGYCGTSFGGGLGALAIPWDDRIVRAHLALPTFGHHPLRLHLPAVGSVASVQSFEREHPGVALKTLQYFDAASAIQHAALPVHFALAPFDPFVPPPGQFAIYNACPEPKSLHIQRAGHHPYAGEEEEQRQLLVDLREFFASL